MRRIGMISLTVFVTGCFDVEVTNNWAGSGTSTALCTAFVADATTTYPSYDYAQTFDPLTTGNTGLVQFDHAAHGLTAGSYLWVSCTLSDGVTAVKAFCDVEDPERRDFLFMTINSDQTVTCLEGVSPPM